MFKIDMSEEDRARADERQAQESATEQAREDQHRRRWAIETAAGVFHGEGAQGNLFDYADRVYNYVYGAKA